MFNTLIYYKGSRGGYPKLVDWFNAQTPLHEYSQRISNELGFKSFKLEIEDQYGEFVDFNQYYQNSFSPFRVNQQTENLGAQPSTSTEPIIKLRIVETAGKITYEFDDFNISINRKSAKFDCNLSSTSIEYEALDHRLQVFRT
jgi:hypothetical protein